MYTLSLAWRYATCRWVNLVACITIALCVLVQIVVMSVLDGMLLDYQRRIEGIGEQITLHLPGGRMSADVFRRLAHEAESLPRVEAVTPVLQRYAALSRYGHRSPVLVRGIDLSREWRHGAVGEYVKDIAEPRWSVPGNGPPPEGLLIGEPLAEGFLIQGTEVQEGAHLFVEYPDPDGEGTSRRRLPVTSRFTTGIQFIDTYYVFVPLLLAREMFSSPEAKEVSFGAVWLADIREAPEVKEALTERFAKLADELGIPEVKLITAQERWGRVMRGMEHENRLMELVMAFISLSSGFAIFAVLYTLVAGRIRDIGILRSIGAARSGVALTFLLVGFFLGLAGTVVGTAGGLALAPNINEVYHTLTGQPLYPPHLFGVENMPVYVDGGKAAIRAVAAVLLSVVATLPVAVWAGVQQPLEALRHE